MVAGTLTAEMQSVGAELTKRLDEAALNVRAAFWLYDAEHRGWRLVFATPKVRSEGPKQVYKTIQSALSKVETAESGVSLQDVAATAPDDPVVGLLRAALRSVPGISGVRFSGSAIKGVLVSDAYVYRLM